MSHIRIPKHQQRSIELLLRRRKNEGRAVTAEQLAELLPPLPTMPPTLKEPRNWAAAYMRRQRGFTLLELLVVVVIIVAVSAVALPVVLPALSHRQITEAARQLQGALAGCRDAAANSGQPSGIRLLPDPAFPLGRLPSGQLDPSQPLVYSRWVPIDPAPAYTTGTVSVYPAQQGSYPAAVTGGLPAVVLEQSPGRWQIAGAAYAFVVGEPTTWYWNVRVGERVRVGDSGHWYTIAGPIVSPNPEGFVNVGPAGTVSPLTRIQSAPDGSSSFPTYPEFLILVNGIDDNGDGYIDSGFDGLDNNANGIVDDPGLIDPTGATPGEWEQERWLGPQSPQLDVPYTVRRRPAPSSGAREQALPTNVVIDATTWGSTRSRSRLPIDPSSGAVELMVYPGGVVVPTTRYGVPTSVGMDGAFLHFWLAERSDVGLIQPGGEYSVVTVTSRTGRITAASNPPVGDPFSAAQQGAR